MYALTSATSREASVTTALTALVLLAIASTAWLSDDALIAYRSAVNLVDGYGLTWNIFERVQSFTCPLWTLIVAAAFFITRELFWTTIILNLAFTALTVGLLFRLVPGSRAWKLLLLLGILFSNSFVDFSTSGLENSLLHLLLVTLIYLARTPAPSLFRLGLIVSGIVLTRHDAGLLIGPLLVFLLYQNVRRPIPDLGRFSIGLTPFLLWTIFSVLYYGLPFPNTAYAKLTAGVSPALRYQQGIEFLLLHVTRDPVTTATILLGMCLPFFVKQRLARPIALGIVLQLIYLINIGGDFMLGRFLSAAHVLAITNLALCFLALHTTGRRILTGAISLAACAAIFLGQVSLIQWKVHPSKDFIQWLRSWCSGTYEVCDERGVYFERLGVLPVLMRGESHPAALANSRLREPVTDSKPIRVVRVGAAGEAGFLHPRSHHLLDELGLSDPLLAHLPSRAGQTRPGHYLRDIPAGYEESLLADENLIVEPETRLLYDRVRLLTRTPVLHTERLRKILSSTESMPR